jgi:hypothetical protein
MYEDLARGVPNFFETKSLISPCIRNQMKFALSENKNHGPYADKM